MVTCARNGGTFGLNCSLKIQEYDWAGFCQHFSDTPLQKLWDSHITRGRCCNSWKIGDFLEKLLLHPPPEFWHISFRRLFQQSGALITSINGDGTVVTSVFSHDVTNPLTTMNPQCSCGKIQLSCSFLGACSHYAGSKSNVCWCCGEDCGVRASSAKWNISFSAPDTKHGSFDCSYIAQAVYWISA